MYDSDVISKVIRLAFNFVQFFILNVVIWTSYETAEGVGLLRDCILAIWIASLVMTVFCIIWSIVLCIVDMEKWEKLNATILVVAASLIVLYLFGGMAYCAAVFHDSVQKETIVYGGKTFENFRSVYIEHHLGMWVVLIIDLALLTFCSFGCLIAMCLIFAMNQS